MAEKFVVSFFSEGVSRPTSKYFPTEAEAVEYYDNGVNHDTVSALTLEKITTLRKKR